MVDVVHRANVVNVTQTRDVAHDVSHAQPPVEVGHGAPGVVQATLPITYDAAAQSVGMSTTGAAAGYVWKRNATNDGWEMGEAGTKRINVLTANDDTTLVAHVETGSPSLFNTFIGAGFSVGLTTAYSNAGFGTFTLAALTTGFENAAFGQGAMFAQTSGNSNTAVGAYALFNNTTGYDNVAVGNKALNGASGSTAFQNVAVGMRCMTNATTASNNVGLGYLSLQLLTTGTNNTALGWGAGSLITTGSGNVFIGADAGSQLGTNTSNKLVIANSNTLTPLIGGDFSTGDLAFSGYYSTRDDSLASPPVNFIYTDASGNLKSAPTDLIQPATRHYARNGNDLYLGTAPFGTLTSAAAWYIARVTYASGVRTAIAHSSHTAVWDNYLTETYT